MRNRLPQLRCSLPANGSLGETIVRRRVSRGALYLGFFALALQAAAASAQEKIEGKVVGTKLTHCDMNVKIGGCAGTLTMERKADGKTEELTFNVPLGTPITRGGKTEYLPALRGKTVVLTHVTEKNERVAKAIEVAK
jgi:hypothetical protein